MVLRGDFYIRDYEQIKDDEQQSSLKEVYSLLIKNVKKTNLMKN